MYQLISLVKFGKCIKKLFGNYIEEPGNYFVRHNNYIKSSIIGGSYIKQPVFLFSNSLVI